MRKFDPQSQAVIMCGISGSGKTHYARQLEDTGYIRLSSDAIIWDKVGPGLFNMTNEQQKELFAESKEEILNRLTSLLKSGKKVVVDATNCRRIMRDTIRKICAEANVNPQFVYCHADKEELWHRLSQRKGMGPDDLLVSREQLSEYWNGFETPQEDEKDFIFLISKLRDGKSSSPDMKTTIPSRFEI